MTDVTPIFDEEYLEGLVSHFDDSAFQSSFNNYERPDSEQLVQLKLGSMLGYEKWVSGLEPDVANLATSNQVEPASRVFDRWLAYVVTAYPHRPVELRDLFLMSTSALWARRPTELRHVLRLGPISAIIDLAASSDQGWPSRVREAVSRALMLVARQSGRGDVENARSCLNELRNLQRLAEVDWLKEAERPQQTALELLALYHCAQATDLLP
ncbi:hypothetical protein H1W37_19735 [Stappia taiwanensis]|uniref:Uncharacterized protein n=1 Tax=Stappia taiwanensis TaxID=992267 RepID=A0A838XTY5_9HYPH|nr:hypothetical protein [Stappia taiwanensis]MBA4613895.1 hypothetical protein [Stappia taiwanensis]GGF07972.1 hypothetical protein GCM10007285_39830 [Stappia taiwanensis]